MELLFLISKVDFTLPLKNPVVIFSLVLFIILFAPILLQKIKIPHIIGLIIAGVIVGPYGFNLLSRDSSIVLFGTVGLLYIMFLAGLEIDITEFKKNRKQIAVFGIATFLLPLSIGCLASYYVLGYSFLSSLLLASMFSTHTLVSYPIASRYGIVRNRAVALTVGGTMITDILALLILAGIAGAAKGEAGTSFWVQLSVSCLAFVATVFFVLPPIIRWFFKNFHDSVSQYIFVLAIVFLSSFLAEVAGLEAIIGAFFSGLVLNTFVPHSSPLMNRIDFVGNALFIPFFLIGVGMLVDVRVLVKGTGALEVAGVIVSVALLTKYLAAYITRRTFKLSKEEGNIIFGLSASHAAATLAIILVGYNIIVGESENGEPIRLLDEDVLNGTILLILVSCAVSSVVVEKAARKMAVNEETSSNGKEESNEKILLSLAHPESVTQLVDLAVMLKPKRSEVPIYALHVVSDALGDENVQVAGRKMLDAVTKYAAATENKIIPLTRFDSNISNGIVYTIKGHDITDVLISIQKTTEQQNFFGVVAQETLQRTFESIFIYRAVQPLNTLKRIIVAVTPSAEDELGFEHWLHRLSMLSKEAALPVTFYSTQKTSFAIRAYLKGRAVEADFKTFDRWEDFLIFSRELKRDDLFFIVTSRKNNVSHNEVLEKLPYYLLNYFSDYSFILLYPKQIGHEIDLEGITTNDYKIIEALSERLGSVNKAGSLFKRLFRK
ncbi:cation:proton antiporter [Desertivirga brevis]|uniref:cation:proton antiporter n=1 Tax=Desertivirga brevis TaxID=2810310 RepID=UPI001A95D203|nr:cation:proton antiporter [Pedobacter sp. SYSU D00873]